MSCVAEAPEKLVVIPGVGSFFAPLDEARRIDYGQRRSSRPFLAPDTKGTPWDGYYQLAMHAEEAQLTEDEALAWLNAGLVEDPAEWRIRMLCSPSQGDAKAKGVAKKLIRHFRLGNRESRMYRELVECFYNRSKRSTHGPQQGLKPMADYGEESRKRQRPGEDHPLRGCVQEVGVQASPLSAWDFRFVTEPQAPGAARKKVLNEKGQWSGKGEECRSVSVLNAPPLLLIRTLAHVVEPKFASRA